MIRLLLVWLVNALALLALPLVFPWVSVDSFTTALVAALVLLAKPTGSASELDPPRRPQPQQTAGPESYATGLTKREKRRRRDHPARVNHRGAV